MLVVYPSWDNPVFQEWRLWRARLNEKWTQEGQDAKDSIERIANHLYKDGCVVGHMIMQCDLAEMENENPVTPAREER